VHLGAARQWSLLRRELRFVQRRSLSVHQPRTDAVWTGDACGGVDRLRCVRLSERQALHGRRLRPPQRADPARSALHAVR
jgi:hypothetical protein